MQAGIPRTILLAVVALAALSTLGATSASARPGALDPTFGDRGRVGVAAPWAGAAIRIADAPDGSIAVAGKRTFSRFLPGGGPNPTPFQWTLARIGADGRQDPSFGGGSVAVEAPGGLAFQLEDVDVDSQGRIVVFGQTIDFKGPTSSIPSVPQDRSLATVIRYRQDGTLDPSFGGGDGVFSSDFGLPPSPGSSVPTAIARGGIDPFGRPVLFVAVEGYDRSCLSGSGLRTVTKLVARLLPDGEIDSGFGEGDGIAYVTGVGEVVDFGFGRLGNPVYLASPSPIPCNGPFALVGRLGLDGVAGTPPYPLKKGFSGIDLAVGGGGWATVLERQPNQGGPEPWPRSNPVLALDHEGKPNRRFGRRGLATIRFPGGKSNDMRQVLVDSRDRVLLAGTALVAERRAARPIPRRALAVVRVGKSGTVDKRFGRRGLVTTRFGPGIDVTEEGALIDAAGRLVVAGLVKAPGAEEASGFALARYRLGR
jgi:uncharacterized delta-60 repeat protein